MINIWTAATSRTASGRRWSWSPGRSGRPGGGPGQGGPGGRFRRRPKRGGSGAGSRCRRGYGSGGACPHVQGGMARPVPPWPWNGRCPR